MQISFDPCPTCGRDLTVGDVVVVALAEVDGMVTGERATLFHTPGCWDRDSSSWREIMTATLTGTSE
jgi:hypothetical protein